MYFFFNDTATTEIYTLSLHDALPISRIPSPKRARAARAKEAASAVPPKVGRFFASPAGPCASCRDLSKQIGRHTSELQSHLNIVCRLLLEKKKTNRETNQPTP